MKTRVSPSRQSAFTLIELLVVISIIAILMGLLFPAVTAIIDNSNRAKAASAVKDIVNACNSYYNDYGKFAVYSAAADSSGDHNFQSYGDEGAGACKVKNNKLFNTLRAIAIDGDPNAAHAMNPRQQKYISGPGVKNPKNPKSGFADGNDLTNPDLQGCYMDPWGMQYCVVLDMDGAQEIEMKKFYSDLDNPEEVLRFGTVAFSMAKDGIRGAQNYQGMLSASPSSAPDDVVSWR